MLRRMEGDASAGCFMWKYFMSANRGLPVVWFIFMVWSFSWTFHGVTHMSDRTCTKRRHLQETRFVAVAKITRAKRSDGRISGILKMGSRLRKIRSLLLEHAFVGLLGALQRTAGPIHGCNIVPSLDISDGSRTQSRRAIEKRRVDFGLTHACPPRVHRMHGGPSSSIILTAHPHPHSHARESAPHLYYFTLGIDKVCFLFRHPFWMPKVLQAVSRMCCADSEADRDERIHFP